MGLGTEGYSPSIVAQIEYVGGNGFSFQQGSEILAMAGRLSISAKHVQRVTERVGAERARERDEEVAKFRAGTLVAQRREPPRVVAVHIDGGKLQLRDDDAAPGVFHPRWGDTKVAALVSYTAPDIIEFLQPGGSTSSRAAATAVELQFAL